MIVSYNYIITQLWRPYIHTRVWARGDLHIYMLKTSLVLSFYHFIEYIFKTLGLAMDVFINMAKTARNGI